MNKGTIMSGMRPTGQLHLGHYFGVLTNWVALQSEYDCFFSIADLHALTTKYDKTEDLAQNTLEVALDWLSSGIDPEVSTVFLQSMVPQTAEIHMYLSMITPQTWVERDPTLKDMVKILRDNEGGNADVSYGLLGYPVLMTADILTFNAEFVPVGKDQVAHLEISRDIVRRFNNIYSSNFNEPKPKLTEIPLLKGLDGQKMGKSFNNDIKIADSEELTAKKIMGAMTDKNRIRRDDQGNPDNCEVAYTYWKIFGSKEDVAQVGTDCKAGKIGCADCKRNLACKVNDHLREIRTRRTELAAAPEKVKQILLKGSEKARIEAQKTLNKIKDSVRVFR